jgi:hypothetical protein
MAVAKVFFDADLRYGIDGLKGFLKQKRIAISAMKGTDFVLFLNRRRNKCKMISFSDRGTYLTSFGALKGRMTLEDLKRIPGLYRETSFLNPTMERQIRDFLGSGVQVYTEGQELKIS